jgi:FKBP-type peptidyl-prolyl cis-trans isomerase
VPGSDETIEFHYRMMLTDGEEIDSSFLRDPLKRQMSGLLPGLRYGLLTMKEGGRAKLILPPELAYGAGGMPGRIPADSWLVYDVEFLSIE